MNQLVEKYRTPIWNITHDTKFLSWANVSPEWFLSTVEHVLKETYIPVGISGLAGSGKDSGIQLFRDYYSTYIERLSFAEPLKKIARIIGFTDEQLTNRVKKETPDSFWKISPRQFLQMCGTEMFRNVWRQDVWVELARKKLKQYQKRPDKILPPEIEMWQKNIVFFTDVRFPNEADMIKKEGGIIVKIIRDCADVGCKHTSESLIKDIPADLTIVNDCKTSEDWSVKFAYELIKHLKRDAFVYGHSPEDK